MIRKNLFDDWADKYDRWFTTPIGKLVKAYEKEVILDLLNPSKGERILDAGCGSGIFTMDVLDLGASVVGLDISLPMLKGLGEKTGKYPLHRVMGDMTNLPFEDKTFDRTVSVTALEFIEDGSGSIKEMFRVTKQGGCIVIATLNSLSPWAVRRRKKAQEGKNPLFENVFFRSPDEMRALSPVEAVVKTAIHFQKDDDPVHARKIEMQGQSHGLNTGAFVIARWEKH